MRTWCSFLVVCGALSLQACNCGGTAAPADGGIDAGAETGRDGGLDAGAQDAGRVLWFGEVQPAVIASTGNLLLLLPDGDSDVLVFLSDLATDPPLAPRWSPDGTRVAFANGRSAYLRETDGEVTRFRGGDSRPGFGPRRVEWSPDGVLLALDGVVTIDESEDPGLLLVPLDGGSAEPLVAAVTWGWESNDSLLYSQLEPQGFVTLRYQVDAGVSTPFVDGLLLATAPGGRLVLQRSQAAADGGEDAVLLLGEPDGGMQPLLPPGSAAVANEFDGVTLSPWGPEAAAVLTSRSATTVVLWFSDAGVRTLAEGPIGNTTQPRCLRFVPGGEYLSYVAGEDPPQLFVVSRDGQPVRLETPALALPGELGCLDWRVAP